MESTLRNLHTPTSRKWSIFQSQNLQLIALNHIHLFIIGFLQIFICLLFPFFSIPYLGTSIYLAVPLTRCHLNTPHFSTPLFLNVYRKQWARDDDRDSRYILNTIVTHVTYSIRSCLTLHTRYDRLYYFQIAGKNNFKITKSVLIYIYSIQQPCISKIGREWSNVS